MRIEKQYRWKTLWAGKWGVTRHHATEEDIRVLHPEAICLPETLIEREVPETDDEMRERMRTTSTGVLTLPTQYKRLASGKFFPEINPDDVPF